MRQLPKLAVLVFLLCGCVASQVSAPPSDIERIGKLAVVAIEAPPLGMPPWMVRRLPLNPTVVPYVVPDPQTGSPQPVGFVAAGIFMLGALAIADAEMRKMSLPLDDALAGKDAWIPTVVLAQEAVDQLAPGGGLEMVKVPGFRKIPGVTFRGRTVLMENWMAPIRAWYNGDTSPFDYSDLGKERVDGVLEVGILNYEIAGELFLVQVMLKLVDSQSGKVLGRAREWANSKVDSPERVFAGDAQRFKELFARITAPLVASNLKAIGLVAR